MSRNTRRCMLPWCNKAKDRELGISHHNIPTDPLIRKKWVQVIESAWPDFIEPRPGSNYHVICSTHFRREDMMIPDNAVKRGRCVQLRCPHINFGAVPSLNLNGAEPNFEDEGSWESSLRARTNQIADWKGVGDNVNSSATNTNNQFCSDNLTPRLQHDAVCGFDQQQNIQFMTPSFIEPTIQEFAELRQSCVDASGDSWPPSSEQLLSNLEPEVNMMVKRCNNIMQNSPNCKDAMPENLQLGQEHVYILEQEGDLFPVPVNDSQDNENMLENKINPLRPETFNTNNVYSNINIPVKNESVDEESFEFIFSLKCDNKSVHSNESSTHCKMESKNYPVNNNEVFEHIANPLRKELTEASTIDTNQTVHNYFEKLYTQSQNYCPVKDHNYFLFEDELPKQFSVTTGKQKRLSNKGAKSTPRKNNEKKGAAIIKCKNSSKDQSEDCNDGRSVNIVKIVEDNQDSNSDWSGISDQFLDESSSEDDGYKRNKSDDSWHPTSENEDKDVNFKEKKRKSRKLKKKEKSCVKTNKSTKVPTASRYQCEHCGEVIVKTNRTIQNHLYKMHGINSGLVKMFKCEICEKQFKQEKSLKSHVAKHSDERPYECCECGRKYASNLDLNNHKYKKHKIISCVCNVCGRSFSRKDNLKLHSLIHTGHKPYLCNQCGMLFNQAFNLVVHIKSHDRGTLPVKNCRQCGREFPGSIEKLAAHIIKAHMTIYPFRCQKCGHVFKDENTLGCHVRQHVQ